MSVFKVWIEIEECDDDTDEYERVSPPVCLGTFDTYQEAERVWFGLGMAHGGLMEDEIAANFTGTPSAADMLANDHDEGAHEPGSEPDCPRCRGID